MSNAAAQCDPIINAWHGHSWDSVNGTRVNEEKNRLSIKSQNYVGMELNPAFHSLVFSVDDDNHRSENGMHKSLIQDTICMTIGL